MTLATELQIPREFALAWPIARAHTPECINKMQQEVFESWSKRGCLKELRRLEPRALVVYRRYLDELGVCRH